MFKTIKGCCFKNLAIDNDRNFYNLNNSSYEYGFLLLYSADSVYWDIVRHIKQGMTDSEFYSLLPRVRLKYLASRWDKR